MANIKQQMKRDITNQKKRELNNAFRSSLKSAVKAYEAALASGNKEEASKAYSFVCKKFDKAVSKCIYHKNKVANEKSRLAKKLNAMA
jgi:small subunit ribosomal protein S20